MRTWFVSMSFALLATLCACDSGGTTPNPGGFDRAAEIAAMISRHNSTRANAGRSALSQNVLLNEIAQDQAAYMASIGTLTHIDATGGDSYNRAQAIGYNPGPIGENIGYNMDAESLYNAWLGSDDHHDNIVDPDYVDIGIGVASVGSTQYWCIVFGAH